MSLCWLCLWCSFALPSGGVKIVQMERGSGYLPFTTTTTTQGDEGLGFFRMGLHVCFISLLKRNERSCRLWSLLASFTSLAYGYQDYLKVSEWTEFKCSSCSYCFELFEFGLLSWGDLWSLWSTVQASCLHVWGLLVRQTLGRCWQVSFEDGVSSYLGC